MQTMSTRRSPNGSTTAGRSPAAPGHRWLDLVWSGLPTGDQITRWTPRVELMENGDSYRIVAELPGVGLEDIHVSVENDVLLLRGERRSPDAAEYRVHRSEREFGPFERSFSLATTVDVDRIEARYESGVLTVTLPKAEEARRREVAIQRS